MRCWINTQNFTKVCTGRTDCLWEGDCVLLIKIQELATVDVLTKCLLPFQTSTTMLSADKRPTLGKVIPIMQQMFKLVERLPTIYASLLPQWLLIPDSRTLLYSLGQEKKKKHCQRNEFVESWGWSHWSRRGWCCCTEGASDGGFSKKYMVIPATVSAEILFSKAGKLISIKRNRIKHEKVNMMLFLNKNLQWVNKLQPSQNQKYLITKPGLLLTDKCLKQNPRLRRRLCPLVLVLVK